MLGRNASSVSRELRRNRTFYRDIPDTIRIRRKDKAVHYTVKSDGEKVTYTVKRSGDEIKKL